MCSGVVVVGGVATHLLGRYSDDIEGFRRCFCSNALICSGARDARDASTLHTILAPKIIPMFTSNPTTNADSTGRWGGARSLACASLHWLGACAPLCETRNRHQRSGDEDRGGGVGAGGERRRAWRGEQRLHLPRRGRDGAAVQLPRLRQQGALGRLS